MEAFDPATHREKYGKTEAEIGNVKNEITGDKSAEELADLVAKRDEVTANLNAQRDAAEDAAREDDANLYNAKEQIKKLTTDIEAYNKQIQEITEIEKIRTVSDANMEKDTFKIINPPEMGNKTMFEVFEYLRKVYGESALAKIPSNLNILPDEFKDGNLHHFFGSAYRPSDSDDESDLYIPYVYYDYGQEKFIEDPSWKGNIWSKDDCNRAVILKNDV